MKTLLFITACLCADLSLSAKEDSLSTGEKKVSFFIQDSPIMRYQFYSAAFTQGDPIRMFMYSTYLRPGIIHNPSNLGIGLTGHYWSFWSSEPLGLPEPSGGFGGFGRYYPFFMRNGIFDKIGILVFLEEIKFDGYLQVEYLLTNYYKDEYGFPVFTPGFSTVNFFPGMGIDFHLRRSIYLGFWTALHYSKKENEEFSYHRSTGTVGLLFKF